MNLLACFLIVLILAVIWNTEKSARRLGQLARIFWNEFKS